MEASTAISILIAEDDPDDRLLIKEALTEARLANGIKFVEDGQEVMDYLCRRGEFADLKDDNLPGLILMDLNMPRKDGRETIREIKSDPDLKRIPIVVLTTSEAEEDVFRTYESGVNSFITKPVTFEGLVDVMRTISNYWLQIVRLP